jgi:hypothetical protein
VDVKIILGEDSFRSGKKPSPPKGKGSDHVFGHGPIIVVLAASGEV